MYDYLRRLIVTTSASFTELFVKNLSNCDKPLYFELQTQYEFDGK